MQTTTENDPSQEVVDVSNKLNNIFIGIEELDEKFDKILTDLNMR